LSREQSQSSNRKEEIRGLFVFGLLAVLSSIRVQYYSTNTPMTMEFEYGSFNLLPLLDNIILLWSLYAFFMVLGLSGDVIGNKAANSFRRVSTLFLQWNFIILGSFSIPIGFIAYGYRFSYVLLLIFLAVIVGIIFLLHSKKPLKFQNRFKSLFTRKNIPVALALIFIISSYIIIGYPKTWFASDEVPLIAFIVSAVTITILLFLEAKKEEDTYPLNDDYYC
jgi:hypothetical protein